MVEAVGEVLVVEQRVQNVHGQEHRRYIQHLQENADLAYFATQLDTKMCELQVKKKVQVTRFFVLVNGGPDRAEQPNLFLYVNLVAKEAQKHFQASKKCFQI